MVYAMAASIDRQRSPYRLKMIEDSAALHQLWTVDNAMYPNANVDWDSFGTWWQRYQPGLKVITNNDGSIVAGLGLWPIAEVQIRAFVAGDIAECELMPLTVDQLDLMPTRFWYCSGVFTLVRGQLDSPLRKLLRCAISGWSRSTHVSYDRSAFCFALGFSDQGRAMLDRFGFDLVRSGELMPDSQPMYSRAISAPTDLRGLLAS